MRRHLLGLIGALFVAAWGWLLATGGNQVVAGSSLRIGLLLLALWLALPQLAQIRTRFPLWLLSGMVIGGLIIAVRPRAALWVLPLAAALAFLQFVGWLFKPLPRR